MRAYHITLQAFTAHTHTRILRNIYIIVVYGQCELNYVASYRINLSQCTIFYVKVKLKFILIDTQVTYL